MLLLYLARKLLLYLARKLLLYLACKLLMGLPLQWRQCLLLLRRTLQKWKKPRSCCSIMLCPRPDSGRTSYKDSHQPRGRLFGAFTTRGEGITQASSRFPEIVSAIHLLASTRPSGFTSEPYMAAQLNASPSLPLHKDKKQFLQVMGHRPRIL